MLNIRRFTDIDGNEIEIDRRNVSDAYVGQHEGRSTIQVHHGGEGALVALGIGARNDIEAWLGRPLTASLPEAVARTSP